MYWRSIVRSCEAVRELCRLAGSAFLTVSITWIHVCLKLYRVELVHHLKKTDIDVRLCPLIGVTGGMLGRWDPDVDLIELILDRGNRLGWGQVHDQVFFEGDDFIAPTFRQTFEFLA